MQNLWLLQHDAIIDARIEVDFLRLFFFFEFPIDPDENSDLISLRIGSNFSLVHQFGIVLDIEIFDPPTVCAPADPFLDKNWAVAIRKLSFNSNEVRIDAWLHFTPNPLRRGRTLGDQKSGPFSVLVVFVDILFNLREVQFEWLFR